MNEEEFGSGLKKSLREAQGVPSVERAATVTFTLKSGTLVLTEEEARFVYTALRQWYGRKK